MPEEMTKEEAWEKVRQHKEKVRAKKKEKGLNLWPIEEGLEDDIIDYIKGKKLTEAELMDLEDRLEIFFYGCRLKCRKRTYFFSDGLIYPGSACSLMVPVNSMLSPCISASLLS